MNDEKVLDDLRRDVGLEATLGRIVAQPDLARSLQAAVEATLSQPGEPPRVPQAAALSGLAPAEFSLRFREAAGVPFHDFVDRVRVDAALVQLATTHSSPETVAQELGFIGSATLGLSIAEYTGLPFAAVLSILRP